jgi:hypothetical protein
MMQRELPFIEQLRAARWFGRWCREQVDIRLRMSLDPLFGETFVHGLS